MRSFFAATLLVLMSRCAVGQEAFFGFEWDVQQGSFVVKQVLQDSSMEENDVLVGDIVLSVDGLPPSSTQQMEALTQGPAGRKAEFRILEPDGTQRLVTLEKRVPAFLYRLRWVPVPNDGDAILAVLEDPETYSRRVSSSGAAVAEGSIMLDDQPAAGIQVAVLHGNNLVRTPLVVTDDRGSFSVSVPSGAVRFFGFWVRRAPALGSAVLLTESSDWEALAPDLSAGQRFRLPPIRLAGRLGLITPGLRAMLRVPLIEFRWAPVTGAERYRFRLDPSDPGSSAGPANVDEEWVVEPSLCCYRVPLSRLLGRHTYYHWSVDAYDGRGRKLASSDPSQGVFVFRRP